MSPTHRIKYEGAALPEGANVVNLWSMVDGGSPGRYLGAGLKWFVCSIWNDQAGTVNGYFSNDGGTTWRLFQTESFGALGPSDVATTKEFFIEPYLDVKFEWVNGGVTQTIFDVNLCTSPER